MPQMQLAQLNIAFAKAPMDDPIMQDFVAQIDAVNVEAENSPGFVWRLQTEEGNATGIRVFEEEDVIINMSVWESLEALKDYIYNGLHVKVLQRKADWFSKMESAHLVLWWIPEGHIPDIDEALMKLSYINEYGPTPEAFTIAKPFQPV